MLCGVRSCQRLFEFHVVQLAGCLFVAWVSVCTSATAATAAVTDTAAKLQHVLHVQQSVTDAIELQLTVRLLSARSAAAVTVRYNCFRTTCGTYVCLTVFAQVSPAAGYGTVFDLCTFRWVVPARCICLGWRLM
jgi:hypothetical protein